VGGRPSSSTHHGVDAARPDGTVLYELLTGHPDRTPRELVFLADLTVELRAWPTDTWAKVGVDPQATARAVMGGWQRGDLPGLRLGGLSADEALALERPAMTYVRAQLGDRLGSQLARPYQRWQHLSSGRRAGRPVPVAADTAGCGGVPGGHRLSGHRPRLRKQRWTANACRVQVRSRPDTRSAATVQPSGRHRQVAAVPQCTSDTLAVSAGGGQCPLSQSAGVHGWSAAGGRDVPALLMAAAVSGMDSGRPASTRPHSQTHRGRGPGVRFRGHLLGFRAHAAQLP
jgi:hypothetical protein